MKTKLASCPRPGNKLSWRSKNGNYQDDSGRFTIQPTSQGIGHYLIADGYRTFHESFGAARLAAEAIVKNEETV